MSLSFDLSHIEDWQHVCYHDYDEETQHDGFGRPVSGRRLSTVTEVLIFATIAVGLGGITESNAAEFYGRLKLVEKLTGHLMHTPGPTPYFFSVDDIRRHIGLSTNVSDESRAKFLKRYANEDVESASREFTRLTS